MDSEKIRLFIILYFVIVNILTFSLFASDKYRAVRRGWRIRESVLFGMSLVGGALGGLISMFVFRHKTKKALFEYGMPIAVVLHIVFIFIYFGGYAK